MKIKLKIIPTLLYIAEYPMKTKSIDHLVCISLVNCQGSEKRLLKDESNSVTSHPSLLDFPLQILAYKLKSGVVSVVSLDLIYLHQSPLSSTLLTSEHHRIYILLIIRFSHFRFRQPFKGRMHHVQDKRKQQYSKQAENQD